MPTDQTARKLDLPEQSPIEDEAVLRQPTMPESALSPYVQIARADHWVKNLFMLFGVLLAFFIEPSLMGGEFVFQLVFSFLSVCFVASSNYVLNEILDAQFDKYHPEKRHRPIPSGLVNLKLAYMEWALLGAAGLLGLFSINSAVGFSGLALWVMGIIYNVRPLRAKEIAYLDVITESVNNPIRLLLGWFVLIPTVFPPVSLLIAYWMFGAFFMALKRFAEYRQISNKRRATLYRRSFAYYNEDRLLVSFFFYAVIGSLFAGIFTVRYHLELILFLPVAAAVLAQYLRVGLRPDSPVQSPEKLYRQKGLMLSGIFSLLLFVALMFTRVPLLYDIFNVEHMNKVNPLWTLD